MTCPCPPPGPPTIAGFTAFLRTQVGVTALQLPDDSATIPMAFCVALEIVNKFILAASPLLYNLAVYNLGADNVINYAQDVTPIVPYPPNTDSTVGFFAYMRAQFNTLGFVSGVIQAAADETTSESMVVQEAAKEFTLANIQQLKSPWGRAYLGIAQDVGGSAWGVS